MWIVNFLHYKLIDVIELLFFFFFDSDSDRLLKVGGLLLWLACLALRLGLRAFIHGVVYFRQWYDNL